MAATTPVPEPPPVPLLGWHLFNVDPANPNQSFAKLADEYGEIVRLRLPGGRVVNSVSSYALLNEVCDERRFKKTLAGSLNEVRAGTGDGLFTATMDEPNWGIAHRVLMPAFGPMSIRAMFDEMHDLATQLTLKWARHEDAPIMVTEDFTRLTLDTLALCSMGYRFNSFYQTELHPFISAMGDFLVACGSKLHRLPLPAYFYKSQDQKFASDVEIMRRTAREVVDARKAGKSPGRKDLLWAMLEGTDPKTGQKMTDESIINNLITFLIAGHETTSGMLSFSFYQMLRNPSTYRAAQSEVDTIIGKAAITPEHLTKLQYLPAVLRESLRLNSTIQIIGLEAIQDELLAGKYFVPKGQKVLAHVGRAHLDKSVFGDDVHEFKPERMSEENFNRLNREFPNSWKPFGNGQRACIGRPFAWQEALLVMAMLLQTFEFRMADEGYRLELQESLTVKPKGFYMKASLRDGLSPTTLEHRLAGGRAPSGSGKVVNGKANGMNGKHHDEKAVPMTVLYGSNSGTCEALGQRIATDAPAHGFRVSQLEPLDSAANGKLPTDQPVVIVTASYEGQPPDNAAQFVSGIEGLKAGSGALKGVKYAVFGCGHHDWTNTFHRIPKLVDNTLELLGGERLASLGLTDVADGDAFTDFENWEDETLWPALAAKFGGAAETSIEEVTATMSVSVSTPRPALLRQDLKQAVVLDARTLTAPGVPEKRHIEMRLPEGAKYRPGDYLAVLPSNPRTIVDRAMRRFSLPRDAYIKIESERTRRRSLPTGIDVAAWDILSNYVELSQPATKRNVLALHDAATEDVEKAILSNLADTSYPDEISTKKVSVLELLERFPSITLSLGNFLSMLPPMRVRQYSISSSPLANPSVASLTYTVLTSPSLSTFSPPHLGVASNYLASLSPGDALHISVRRAHASFHLPSDPSVPVICIAAGSGIAPFRGFAQERAAMIGAGRQLTPMLLFLGHRAMDRDALYAEDLDRWEKLGACKVYRALSREKEGSEGCAYVQERFWRERGEVVELWNRGAKVFVCGSRKVANALKETVVRIMVEEEVGRGGDGSVIEGIQKGEWFEGVRGTRWMTDVFD